MTETPQEPQESQPSPEPPEAPAEAPAPPAESPAPAAGSLLERFTYGDAFLAGGALLLVLSGLIPAYSVIGLKLLFVPFIAGILCGVIVFLQFQKGQAGKGAAAWALLLGAAGTGAGLNAFFAQAFSGYGSPPFIVYLSIVGGIAVLLAAKAALSEDKKGLAEFFARKLK